MRTPSDRDSSCSDGSSWNSLWTTPTARGSRIGSSERAGDGSGLPTRVTSWNSELSAMAAGTPDRTEKTGKHRDLWVLGSLSVCADSATGSHLVPRNGHRPRGDNNPSRRTRSHAGAVGWASLSEPKRAAHDFLEDFLAMYSDHLLSPWLDRIRAELDDAHLFDGHTHVGSSDPSGFSASFEQLEESLELAGASAAVFPLKEPSGYGEANVRMIEAAQQSGGRLVAFARL